MTMKDLEREILVEAREVTGNKKLRMADIMEWTTGDCDKRDDEIRFRLPKLQIEIAIKKEDGG